MMELLEKLQGVYAKWEGKARPRVGQRSAPEPKHVGEGDIVRAASRVGFCASRRRPCRRPRRRPDTFDTNPNKFGVRSLRVPKVAQRHRSRLLHIDEALLVPYKMQYRPTLLYQSQTLCFRAIQCCYRCLPMNRCSLGTNEHIRILGLENVLNLPHTARSSFIPFNFIKNPLYLLCKSTPHNYKVISQKIVESESVKAAIESAVREDPRTDKNEHKLRAIGILERMKATVSTVLLRFAVWLMHRVMSRMLSGLYVSKGQIEMIKEAGKEDVPIIYLPLHRSHLDYIVVTFLLYLNEVKVPFVAAGDNLLIPLFGALLRGLGGFFIKRRLDFKEGRKDFVYRALLKEYVTEMLKANHSMEFFIEGGRSRTGKSRLPKAGLLSLIVNCLKAGVVSDVYIVPTAISYEKIPDGIFVSEQLGEPKVMESFTAALHSIWRILHSNYGSVRVDFAQPFSLKNFLESSPFRAVDATAWMCPLRRSSGSNRNVPRIFGSSGCSSPPSHDDVHEDQRRVVQSLAGHVVYQSSKSLALMGTNLVALLFMTMHRKGATLQQLSYSLSWLRTQVYQRDCQVMCVHDNAEAVRQACTFLGKKLVRVETIQMEWSSEGAVENNNLRIVFYHPTLRLPHVLELQYYANAAIMVFLTESVAVTALYTIARGMLPGTKCEVVFPRSELRAKILLLFNVLQFEFILALPCQTIQMAAEDAIDSLVYVNVLSVCPDAMSHATTNQRVWAASFAASLGWEEEHGIHITPFPSDEQLKMELSTESLELLEFLRSVLASYIEAYWVVACSLFKLVNQQMEERTFFREIQKVAQDRSLQGLLLFEESSAADTLRNAVKLFEHWKIIEHHQQGSVRTLYLGERWNSDKAIQSVVALIGDFKR